MIRSEFIFKKTGEKLIMFSDGDFEYEKPIKHFGDTFIVKQLVLQGIPQEELDGTTTPSKKSKDIFLDAAILWQKMVSNFKAVKVPKNLIKLLNSTKKSEQESLLKGAIFTPNLLMALLIKAEENGYTLSHIFLNIVKKVLIHQNFHLHIVYKKTVVSKFMETLTYPRGSLSRHWNTEKLLLQNF